MKKLLLSTAALALVAFTAPSIAASIYTVQSTNSGTITTMGSTPTFTQQDGVRNVQGVMATGASASVTLNGVADVNLPGVTVQATATNTGDVSTSSSVSTTFGQSAGVGNAQVIGATGASASVTVNPN
ncbi:hypothetical protein CSC94_23040 [Zhengella mangrovi]|uniref:Curlin n=1 Tax=Zhengella mangrovi TaxID=1982044 RepID=A0A2G1QGR8_9HYPH|nr:hypothetical protein [Zhengella mangrovi]PHP64706.1 hypothetical protein CSC94_23040 [Zhengella mangrovi]